jgi:hypothetical protein
VRTKEARDTIMYRLTDVKIQKTKPGLKVTKLTDGGGLYLHIATSGSKLQRYQYRFEGTIKLMALIKYPEVSLKRARELHTETKHLLGKGVDPMADRKAQKTEAESVQRITFETIFRAWFPYWSQGRAPKHSAQVERRVIADILPAFGDKAVNDVTAGDVRQMTVKIYTEGGARDVARRAHETTSQIYRHAIANGTAENNPATAFRPSDVLPAVESENIARVDVKELPTLLRKMDEYKGTALTRLAMRLMAYTFLRTSELIGGDWSEFDLDSARWDIPKERKKMRKPHIVPLSKQALSVVKEL